MLQSLANCQCCRSKKAAPFRFRRNFEASPVAPRRGGAGAGARAASGTAEAQLPLKRGAPGPGQDMLARPLHRRTFFRGSQSLARRRVSRTPVLRGKCCLAPTARVGLSPDAYLHRCTSFRVAFPPKAPAPLTWWICGERKRSLACSSGGARLDFVFDARGRR